MTYQFLSDLKNKQAKEINSILKSAVMSVDPKICVERKIILDGDQLMIANHRFDLSEIENFFLIGAGKAVLPMAQGVLAHINSQPLKGHLITKHLESNMTIDFPKGIVITKGDHPVPSKKSVQATHKLVRLLGSSKKEDLVICLLSGGGSALMTLPGEGIKLEHVKQITEQLLQSGASIDEINIIRKHIDRVKGGGLLKSIYPAKSVSLILSDVLGNEITSIASGPTAADPSTFQDAKEIIEKYHLESKVNQAIIRHMRKGINKMIPETVKEADSILLNHDNVIIGSLYTAATAAVKTAKKLGFKTDLLSLNMMGEARDVGSYLGNLLKNIAWEKKSSKPFCLVGGGEPTVTIKGKGKGGRNQEVALSAAIEIHGVENCVFISLATDGEDGPTDAAGGIVTGDTIKSGLLLGFDATSFLNDNNSYHFLEKTKSLIRIGPTGTNVNDLYLLIAY